MRAFLLAVLCTLMIFSSCAEENRDDTPMRRDKFDHSGLTTCAACHQMPNPSLVIVVPKASFSHSYAAQLDCVSCHFDPGGTWAGGRFLHQPKPLSCIECHRASKPSGIVPDTRDGFTHAPIYGVDCVLCHTTPGLTFSNTKFSHKDLNGVQVESCQPCHNTRNHAQGEECRICHRAAEPGKNWKVLF